MLPKIIGLAAIMLLSACATAPEATQIVNRSDEPLRVIYVAKGSDVPQTLDMEAGESRRLGAGARLSEYASVEFRGGDANVIFRDRDPNWRASRCMSDCVFIWFGKGRVGITA